MKRPDSNTIFIAALGIILCAATFIMPPCPVWITDNGSKYMVMRTFDEKGTTALQHTAPECAPTGGFHIQHHKGELRSFYPEYYPVLCSLFYSKSCERAAALPAIFGTLFSAYLMLKWTKKKTLAALLALGTPLLFYSFILWEMTLSCAAIFGAVYLGMRKKQWLGAGAVAGISVIFREEAYFVILSLSAAMLLFKEYKNALRFLCGAACGILPVWLWQYIEFGHILGLHGNVYISGTGEQSVSGIVWNYFHHLLRGEPTGKKYETLFIIIPAAIILVSNFGKTAILKAAGIFSALAASVILLLRYTQSGSFCYAAACSTGVFAALPLSWFYFANIGKLLTRKAKNYRILAAFVLIYILTVPAVLTRGDVGLIWSARHFMVLLPFIVILFAGSIKFFQFKKMQSMRFLPVAVAVFAVLQQFAGVYSCAAVANESFELENTIRKTGCKAVASDVFYLPEMTPRLWFECDFYDLSEPDKIEKLTGILPEKMVLILSPQPQFRRIADSNLRYLLNFYTIPSAPIHFKKARGSGFIDLLILKVERKGGSSK